MNRIIWVLVGAVLTLGLISGVGFVSAHYAGNNSQGQNITGLSELPSLEGMAACGMHSDESAGMHEGGMECMGLEVEQMDADNDGVCDSCGMSVEDCEKMEEMHSTAGMDEMHERMHSGNSSNEIGEMPDCGMNNNGMHSNATVGMRSMMN